MKKAILSAVAASVIAPVTFAEEIYAGVDMTKDVAIKTSAGYTLKGNLFKPTTEGEYPVIVTMTPYGKDKEPHYGPEDGIIDASEYAAYEALDPKFWVPHGYALLVVDTTGMNNSEGQFSLFTDQEAKDYYDVIEWAGTQDWSNGAVSTSGVSYLAMNQWKVAAMNPPHLKAIMPWHGMSNIYRDMMYTGGIQETNFFSYWYGKIITGNASAALPDALSYQQNNPIYNDVYAQQVADLSKITVPAYIGAAWSDNGLHLSGTIKAFERIASEEKWLEITGRKKWEQYYTWGAQNRMLEFADHFLKEKDNGWEKTPQLRYELMDSYYLGEEKYAESFPLPNTQYKKFYVKANTLVETAVNQVEQVVISDEQPVRFNYTFTQDTEITGQVKAQLFVETTQGDDLDIFIEAEKLDANGNKINFPIFGSDDGGFTFGMLRASQRQLDSEFSTDSLPEYTFTNPQKLKQGEVVQLDVALSPTSVKFKAGEVLSLAVSQHDINSKKAKHAKTVNEGNILLKFGGEYNSYLQLPMVK
ncbi:CocE/NonD family hydrolase [Vibrio chagasii]|uniref:CocE/NonD family hydrolase n=1 Tax=Vibrio chagasii TaxID=170679 RepID=UPI003DA91145